MKFQWPRSLRTRLLVVYSVGMLTSALLVGLMAFFLAKPFNRYMLQYGAEHFAQGLAKRAQFAADGTPIGFDEEKIDKWLFHSFREDVFVRITAADGRVIFSPTSEEATALAPPGAAFDPHLKRFALQHDGVPMHAATTPIEHGGTTWYVQFAASDRLVLKLRQSFGTPGLHQGILATCLTFLAVFLIATHLTLQRMLHPLRAASIEAQNISPQTLDARLQARDLPDELTPLVEAFNRALDRLQAGFRTQQEFLANAAHELKTPLALIRAQIEMVPPTQRNPFLLQDVDQMARQVQQLLLLAEASEPRNYRMEEVSAQAALAEACDYMARVAERSGVHINYSTATDEPHTTPCWQADRGALFTLLKNLLENAIQHSPQGTTVTVQADPTGFSVTDQGPGVAPADLGKLFERFWRGPTRRDEGAGLGLSICQEIARAHQWQITARPCHPGLEIQVRCQPTDLPQEIRGNG
ncbi:MAG: ATP-binding protein [Acidovorax sp.]|nr:ATP-binding protein [Acidovorax sp.]